MSESVVPEYLSLSTPEEIPGLVTGWRFAASSESFPAAFGQAYSLQSQSGRLRVVEDAAAPLGGRALELEEGQWLNIPRRLCPALNFHGPGGQFTVVAWIRRGQKSNSECEFLAGMWNESQCGRQYGLFLNIGVWRQPDQVCGHLSQVGGPTPGFKYCIDGPVGSTAVPRDAWSTVAMSYDGLSGYAWLNGALDFRAGLNPYSLAGGLFDGGEHGSDFTVGGVDRGGSIGNFFTGRIAGLAVYGRALSPAEIFALSRI
jgi:hypothetical protein